MTHNNSESKKLVIVLLHHTQRCTQVKNNMVLDVDIGKIFSPTKNKKRKKLTKEEKAMMIKTERGKIFIKELKTKKLESQQVILLSRITELKNEEIETQKKILACQKEFRHVSNEIEVERESSVVDKDLDKMYLFTGDERGVAEEVCQVLSEHFKNGQHKSNCPNDDVFFKFPEDFFF